SPLVSKLRENAKIVIGVGVRASTSELLVNNCHEFIFYDDLIAETQPRAASRPRAVRKTRKSAHAPEKAIENSAAGLQLVLETADALFAERGDGAKLWASMVKQALRRRRPDFNESTYGYQSFNDLIEDAAAQGFMDLARDEKSGGYVIHKIHRPT